MTVWTALILYAAVGIGYALGNFRMLRIEERAARRTVPSLREQWGVCVEDFLLWPFQVWFWMKS